MNEVLTITFKTIPVFPSMGYPPLLPHMTLSGNIGQSCLQCSPNAVTLSFQTICNLCPGTLKNSCDLYLPPTTFIQGVFLFGYIHDSNVDSTLIFYNPSYHL